MQQGHQRFDNYVYFYLNKLKDIKNNKIDPFQTEIFTSILIQHFESMKVSVNYPGVKIGFSTQNFLICMPPGVDNLKEIIDYASAEGYAFIELRDPSAELTNEECIAVADHAKKKKIEVIYEIHKDLFNPEFMEVFKRAVRNTAVFGKPGILRSILSWSEFANDESKRGWTKEELDYLTNLADSCAEVARNQNVIFILENILEPWFGNQGGYGLVDFFDATSNVGLQFDTANPFLPSSRGIAKPDQVAEYLGGLGDRWVTTHLKSGKEGAFQPVLTDNPLSYETVFEAMSKNGVTYAALELLPVNDRESCFVNLADSIRYLREIGIVE